MFGHTLVDCPNCVPTTTQPTPSVNDGFKTVTSKKKSNSGGQYDHNKGGFTKPSVGKKMQYRPKAPPPQPKNMDANKKKNVDVQSTSGAKIVTSNQFDELNMADTDDYGIPTKEVTLEVNSGSNEEAKKDGSLKTATTSQESLVRDPNEKEQAETSKPSSFSSPSTSST